MAVHTQTRDYTDWIGLDAYDRDGDKIGEIENVYLDLDTGRPEWLAIKTGWFGMSSSFAPIVGSTPHEDGIMLDVDEDTVKDAPRVGSGEKLTAAEEERLYSHYAVDRTKGPDAYIAEDRRRYGYETGRRADEGFEIDQAAYERSTAPRRTEEAEVTRREEELDVDTRRRESGKVRLRKYVTTEDETVTVPVQKERVVVEREPAHGTARSSDLGEDEAEITLHEETVDVDKHVVDKEKVRAGKETVTDEETVRADLRKEQVEVERDDRRS